jgi:DNA modification methylase
VGKDVQPKQYINFYEKFIYKIKKHFYPTEKLTSHVRLYDSRRISDILEPNSVDCVFTSPPYFNCLDYTAYYAKIIFSILGVNREEIKKDLIQNFSEYKSDMKKVFKELYKVCKKGGSIIFVVGDKKVKGKTINGAEFFNEITPFNKVEVVNRRYSNSSSQVFDKLNNTQREEQIIIWTK